MPDQNGSLMENRFIKAMIALILVLLALFLLRQLDNIFRPIFAALAYLLTPVLLSLFLYYILRPMVRWLTRLVRLRSLAIVLTFLVVLLVLVIVGLFAGSIIQDQLKDLANRFANYYDSLRNSIYAAGRSRYLADFFARLKVEEKLGSLAGNIFPALQRNLFGLFSTVTNIGAIVILIPFILFYFLKDDAGIYRSLISLAPSRYRCMGADILRHADDTLARYMQGQLIIALVLGALTFLGYLVIGLPNSFILAVITTITSFIPIFGALIGFLPAALIALAISPFFLLKAFIVLVVVQQLEGNLISPRIQGERMHIHPLMVLFVVLTAYILFGFLGSLFAVPAYAVLRVVAKTYLAERWAGVG